MYVDHAGDRGPVILLVHGSILPGWRTWNAQRPLAAHYRLVVPHRSGYPPNPPLDRIDFELQAREIAELIEPRTHVVGHSYGGIVALLAAAIAPARVRSLAVIEPPAFGIARSDPSVEAMIERLLAIAADREQSPRDFLLRFAAVIGATPNLPDPLPPETVASARGDGGAVAMGGRDPVRVAAGCALPEACLLGSAQRRIRRRLRCTR